MSAREFDVTVFGATGFVGRLTARHLAEHAPPGTRVALAGRSRSRLEEVRTWLGSVAADWPLVTADSHDAEQLRDLAARSTAIATTVGPYAEHGLPLVQACAAAGTHYADLTGEVLFVRESIDAAHAAAELSGAKIVHACGFDSVPSDLGVLALAEAVEADSAGPMTTTTYALTGAKGGFSGGTLASIQGQIEQMRSSPKARKLVLDPYALCTDPGAEPDLGKQTELLRPHRDPDLGQWTAPFVMAGYNTRIVRRSNSLQEWRYGRQFRYQEVVATRSGPLGLAAAAGVTALTGALAGSLAFGPTRGLLNRVLPSPGAGPSEKSQAAGYFRCEVHTRTESGAAYVAHVGATGDPGYAATSVMLGESVLALALDDLPETAGVLTPATAMGGALSDRLRARGFTLRAAAA